MTPQRKTRITGAATPERPRQTKTTWTPAAWDILMRRRISGESVGRTASRLIERLDVLEGAIGVWRSAGDEDAGG